MHAYNAATEHVGFAPTRQASIALSARGGTRFMHGRSRMHDIDHRIPIYYVGTEHVGVSSTRQTLPAPSAKGREVFGESHEG